MKQKTLIIIFVTFILSALISCITWHYYYDTKILSIDAFNAKFENLSFKLYDSDVISYDNYAVIVDCKIEDSLRYYEKQTAFIDNFSMIKKAYGAYDPGKVFEYSMSDSIQSIDIYSIYDFDDSHKANSNLSDCFNIYYSGYYYVPDSIILENNLLNCNQINQILSDNERMITELYLVFRLKEKPKYGQHRFIVNFKFNSEKQLTDTTEFINIK